MPIPSTGTPRAVVRVVACVPDVVRIPVVVVTAAVPAAAIESTAPISTAVENAAVEADAKTPIAGIPSIKAATPAPIPRSPQRSDIRRIGPHARHPVPAVIPAPVSRSPYISIPWHGRLVIRVHWKWRRSRIYLLHSGPAGIFTPGIYVRLLRRSSLSIVILAIVLLSVVGRRRRRRRPVVLAVPLILRLRSRAVVIARALDVRLIAVLRLYRTLASVRLLTTRATPLWAVGVLRRRNRAIVLLRNRRGNKPPGKECTCQYWYTKGTKGTHTVSPDLDSLLSTKFCGFRSEKVSESC